MTAFVSRGEGGDSGGTEGGKGQQGGGAVRAGHLPASTLAQEVEGERPQHMRLRRSAADHCLTHHPCHSLAQLSSLLLMAEAISAPVAPAASPPFLDLLTSAQSEQCPGCCLQQISIMSRADCGLCVSGLQLSCLVL